MGRAIKLLRGGSWNNNPRNCRCAIRNNNTRDNFNNNRGFRVVCVPVVAGRVPRAMHSSLSELTGGNPLGVLEESRPVPAMCKHPKIPGADWLGKS
ncbi:hypothetical protein [Phormidium yuhuli]|uniref:hypothetical protein n=1 Tax=Phormidium yuhuli TaxID=2974039 RepID=UPI0035A8C0F3